MRAEGAPPEDAVKERAFVLACRLLVALSFLVQGAGVLRRNVHWDEFIFLARIHQALRGEPGTLFQTAYVHLFGWLPAVAHGEVAQVQVGRGVMLLLWGISLLLLFRLARRFVGQAGSWAAVALAATLREDLIHAASFRVDGLMTPLFLGACLAALRAGRPGLIAAGVLAGALLALSLKAVLLLPVVVVLALMGGSGGRPKGRTILEGAAAFAVTAFVLLGLHAASLPPGPPPAGVPGDPGLYAANAARRMLLTGDLFSRWPVLRASCAANPPAWLFLAVALEAARRRVRLGWDAVRSFAQLLVLAAPLASVAVYRNFWPYAFVSLAPAAWILAAAGWDVARRGPRPWRWMATWGAVAWLAGVPLHVARGLASDGTAVQRQTLEVVHALFPSPVPYVDRVGMVASFPRPLFNMTTFGMETYLERGEPVVAEYIERWRPPLLVLNTSSLAVFPGGPAPDADERPPLLPADVDALQETYAPFWGPVFLAGRAWDRLGAGEEVAFEIHVPGPYTFLAEDAADVNGTRVSPGGTVVLQAGRHGLVSVTTQGPVRLLWGRALREPPFPPLPGPLFLGF